MSNVCEVILEYSPAVSDGTPAVSDDTLVTYDSTAERPDIFPEKEVELIEMPPQNTEATSFLELLDSPNGVPKGWENFFEEHREILERLDRILQRKKHRFYPYVWEIFRAFHCLPTKLMEFQEKTAQEFTITNMEIFYNFVRSLSQNQCRSNAKGKQVSYVFSDPGVWLNFEQEHCTPTTTTKQEVPEGEMTSVEVGMKENKLNVFKVYTRQETVPDVKVVIIGQDPYFTQTRGENTAMGMSFSCRKGHPISPSLKSMFRRLESTVPGFVKPFTGDLTRWANQGVFLYNMALTVPYKEDWLAEKPSASSPAAAHNGIWEGFTSGVIEYLTKTNPRCIYFLWGRKAQDVAGNVPSTSVALESSHPSPLGWRYGFKDMDHFREANQLLADRNEEPIDWRLPNQ